LEKNIGGGGEDKAKTFQIMTIFLIIFTLSREGDRNVLKYVDYLLHGKQIVQTKYSMHKVKKKAFFSTVDALVRHRAILQAYRLTNVVSRNFNYL